MRRSGERGKQGDHGQAGDPGQRGEIGNSGERGTTGTTGARGPAGPAGETGRSRLARTQLAVYLFIVGIVAVGFVKFEQADRASVEQRTEICLRQIESRMALRQVYRDLTVLGTTLIGDDDPDDAQQLQALLAFEEARLAELPEIEPGCPPSPQ